MATARHCHSSAGGGSLTGGEMRRRQPAKAARRTHRNAARVSGNPMARGGMTGTDYGRPLRPETWDRQYREGTLDFLDSLGELAHYAVTAGYVRFLFKSPTILDVGCGHGRLIELLEAFPFKSYVGIDLSPEAIRRARLRPRKNARFHVADLDEWEPAGSFTVIVFCESLNYAKHPVAALLRYARALEGNGAIIVSLYRHRNHGRIWRNIDRFFSTVDATSVRNRKRQTWNIRVLQARIAAPPSGLIAPRPAGASFPDPAPGLCRRTPPARPRHRSPGGPTAVRRAAVCGPDRDGQAIRGRGRSP